MTDRPEPAPISAAATAEREIVISRVFKAPRELVFAAFIDPQHIGSWWGPRGFTTTTQKSDIRPGGEWIYVMHGPDGVDYPNWTRYQEVVRPERLVYEHGGGAPDSPAHFHVTVTFIERPEGTELTMRSLFPTKAARDQVVQRYGAIEGGRQTLARLADHLDAMAGGATRTQRRYSRRFAAPRALVFQAWTDPQHLVAWWGPHDFTSPTCIFEARVGGRIHIDMRGPDGVVHPLHGEVLELAAPHRLVFKAYPADEQGRPLFEVVNTVTFSEEDGHTTVVVDTDVTGVTPAARVPLEGMDVGWAQTLERLDDLLTDPAAAREPARDIVTTRVIPAPRGRVYAAWSDPALLQRWWGPNGFTNTFEVFDLRPGGDWRFVMHGPDGTDYRNHSIFREIRPGELLAFDHLGPMHRFGVRATFYDLGGGTLVRFRMRFTDAAECGRVRAFVAPANEQNFDRLEAVLTGRA
jgi:uncharacterized protein YndB with AHSA1/START domain